MEMNLKERIGVAVVIVLSYILGIITGIMVMGG